jgi:hypothetical protein
MANAAAPVELRVLDSGVTITLLRNLTRRTVLLTKDGAEIRLETTDLLDAARVLFSLVRGFSEARDRVLDTGRNSVAKCHRKTKRLKKKISLSGAPTESVLSPKRSRSSTSTASSPSAPLTLSV